MKDSDTKSQVNRHLYLKNFPEGSEIGDSIVELLKQKSLTCQEAYMGLQYAYNKLHYETNYLKLK